MTAGAWVLSAWGTAVWVRGLWRVTAALRQVRLPLDGAGEGAR